MPINGEFSLPDDSRAELLNILAFHQAYHAGQLAICRRIAGLDGVIKAPGQPQTQEV